MLSLKFESRIDAVLRSLVIDALDQVSLRSAFSALKNHI